MTNDEFSQCCGYGNEYWPLLYWGCGIEKALQWLAQIQEDHSYTFKTVEQRFLPENCHLPYGP